MSFGGQGSGWSSHQRAQARTVAMMNRDTRERGRRTAFPVPASARGSRVRVLPMYSAKRPSKRG